MKISGGPDVNVLQKFHYGLEVSLGDVYAPDMESEDYLDCCEYFRGGLPHGHGIVEEGRLLGIAVPFDNPSGFEREVSTILEC